MAKTVAVEWDAFFQGEIRPKDVAAVRALPAMAAGALGVVAVTMPTAQASVIASAMTHAFQPVIAVIQGLAYPISFISMAGGMLLISVGQRHRGISMIKWAAIGYLGMQLLPGIMDLVAQVGDSMRQP
ncbi:hypothetical protein Alches_12320 [Alicyclobacillus hesperidum subsp. aegles]|uniref:hypothetical protein n=1 Tax=Alicyclobacillus hesperidum TaxID=89784 RepID=UPI00222971B5|nr:hypothetical protein [Alicyclobacillus hesperidum]GLG01193.1 hypothetical protein Alches_12320 [Alicyclobacillus hesperidum subsp. aegles]